MTDLWKTLFVQAASIVAGLAAFVLWSNMIDHQWIAAVPAGALLIGFWFWRRRVVLAASVTWAAYGVYESLLRRGILCDEDCNIRADLLLIVPLLVVLSALAVRSGLQVSATTGGDRQGTTS